VLRTSLRSPQTGTFPGRRWPEGAGSGNRDRGRNRGRDRVVCGANGWREGGAEQNLCRCRGCPVESQWRTDYDLDYDRDHDRENPEIPSGTRAFSGPRRAPPLRPVFCQDNDDGAFRVRTREQTNLKRSDAGRVPGGFPKPGSLERAVR